MEKLTQRHIMTSVIVTKIDWCKNGRCLVECGGNRLGNIPCYKTTAHNLIKNKYEYHATMKKHYLEKWVEYLEYAKEVEAYWDPKIKAVEDRITALRLKRIENDLISL